MAKHEQEYYLMHKDIKVGIMEISDQGILGKVRRNEAVSEHFPLGGQMNDMKFHTWWRDRAIPKTRHGAQNALQKLGYASTDSALVNNLGLSLSDCYWIMPRGEDLAWKDINLFANDFVDTFGEITINRDHVIDIRKETRFDCAASQGELQKKWCIDPQGKRYMIKGNYGASFQQSINEVFASKLHERQGFTEYTPYNLVKILVENKAEAMGCMCYNFCNENIECISAWELLQTIKTKQNESLYFPFKDVCIRLGMEEDYFTGFMDYMIMTDYLISNTDRHMNNIAVMRNPDTLEILGFAPIFDSGNSMFYNIPFRQLNHIKLDEIKTHSFVEKEVRLLQYVHDRSLVDIDRISMDFSIYEYDTEENHIRIPIIQKLYEKKILKLKGFQNGKNPWKYIG